MKAFWSGKTLTCGEYSWPVGDLSCAALNLSKDRIGPMGEGEEDWLDMPWMSFFPDDIRGSVDDLIAFRVYIRFYLSKCRPLVATEGDALAEFHNRLLNLEKVLYRPESPRRTLLPASKNGFAMVFTPVDFGDGSVVAPAAETATLGDLMLLDFMLSLHFRIMPRMCSSCGIYFRPVRPVEAYCKNCRSAGERQRQRAREALADPASAAFKRAAGRVYTRKSRGRLTEEQSEDILRRCEQRREDYLAGHLSLEELVTELSKL